jgi:hypothetical protein
MSAYAAVESIIVAVLVLASALIVLNAFFPGPVHRIRVRLAGWVSLATKEGPLNRFATRLASDGATGGCATSCQSGCNGCGLATRVVEPRPVGDDATNTR